MKPEQENKVLNLLNDLNLNEEQGFKTKDMPNYGGHNNDMVGDVLVLEVDGEVQGFIMYGVVENQCNIMDVFVSPYHRGNGYGTEMFAYLEKKLKEETFVYEIKLGVRPNNYAKNLYERLGFKPYTISMFKPLSI
jgi:ribosomal protein S18 acetylase RimI-like enzyme